jgi:hypothetical protein
VINYRGFFNEKITQRKVVRGTGSGAEVRISNSRNIK